MSASPSDPFKEGQHDFDGSWNMSLLTSVRTFLWDKRKYWRGPIILMLVILAILFAIAMSARILPFILAEFGVL